MKINKLRIRKGDRVIVISGKDKGKKGKVIAAFPSKDKVTVEGVNIVKKHAKPTQKIPQGGIREIEAPLASSKVMIICPACNKPTRVGRKLLADGSKIRICKKCNESLDR